MMEKYLVNMNTEITDKLETSRVISINLTEDKTQAILKECVDEWYEVSLSKSQLLKFIRELKYISEKMVEPENKLKDTK